MRQRGVVKKRNEDYIANETTLELQFDVMFDACMIRVAGNQRLAIWWYTRHQVAKQVTPLTTAKRMYVRV